MKVFVVVLAVTLPLAVLGSTCGESTVPFSLEILPNGLPVLGCARPSCFGWTSQGTPAGPAPMFSSNNGRADGFFRVDTDGQKPSTNPSFVAQTSHCSAAYDADQCPNPNQWVGGIEPITSATQPSRLQCCEYEPATVSIDRGIAYLTAGHIVVGGEVTENGKQTAFDYISNIIKTVGPDGTVSYNVSIHRMPCGADAGSEPVQELQSFAEKKPEGGAAKAFQAPTYQYQNQQYQGQQPYYQGQQQYYQGQQYQYPAQQQQAAYYPVAAPAGNAGMFCFSADTEVLLQGGLKKRMDQLKVGDWVMAGNDKIVAYSRVDSWLHRMPETVADFIHFTMEDGNHLKLTNKHYLYRGDCAQADQAVDMDRMNADMVFAEDVQPHECLFVRKNGITFVETKIAKIEIVKEKGIYAPMTHSGNIVANNIHASCFNIVNDKTMQDTFSGYLTSFANSAWAKLWVSEDSNDVSEIELIPGMSVLVDLLRHVVPSK